MDIIQVPDDLSLSGDLKEFQILSSQDVTFSLVMMVGGESVVILEESYTPESGSVKIEIRDVVGSVLSVTIPTTSGSWWNQQDACRTFRYTISDGINGASSNFVVIKGGIDGIASGFSDSDFLRGNFLTWQPQEKSVQPGQPEFLTYFFRDIETAFVKAYYKDGNGDVQFSTAALYTNEGALSLICLDLSWEYVSSLFPDKVVLAYEAFVSSQSGDRLSYIQRYILEPVSDVNEKYLFVNTLGGVDTLRCTGILSHLPKTNSDFVALNGSELEVNLELEYSLKQNTGFIPDKQYASWLLDFFLSEKRAHLSSTGLRYIVISDQDQEWKAQSIDGFVFEYSYADRSKHNFIERVSTLPEVVDFLDPGSLFFLERRVNDYPLASLEDDVVIPVQDVYGNQWKKVFLSDIIRRIGSNLISISIPTNTSGNSIALEKNVDTGSGTIGLSIKLEDMTDETINNGHIGILSNDEGYMYGEARWVLG